MTGDFLIIKPQLLNDDVLIFKPETKRYFYWIHLPTIFRRNNCNESNSKANKISIDWNKTTDLNINIRQHAHAPVVSNNDCLITFENWDFTKKEFEMQLYINDNENENYLIDLKQSKHLNDQCVKIMNVKNKNVDDNHDHDFHLHSCFWLNSRFVWFDAHTTHTQQVKIYVMDHMQAESMKQGNHNLNYKCNNKFQILNKIGTGSTCNVYNAIINSRGLYSLFYRSFRQKCNVAINDNIVIKQEHHMSSDTVSTLLNEYKILQKIHNEYTSSISCKLYEHFIENNIHHLVLSKCGPSLQHLYLNNNNKFSLFQSLLILNQMIIILYKLHSIGIVHNDIKPENILIDNPKNINNNKHLKLFLIDFGISKIFWDFDDNKHVDKMKHEWNENEENDTINCHG